MPRVKVLVVDDSFFVRKRLVDMLSSDPDIEVIDTAQNGLEAIEKVASLRPDVVTLDIEMPKMDGLTALKGIMSAGPTSVIMVSTLTEAGSQATAQALMDGAVDFIHKPTENTNLKVTQIKEELIAKVKAAAVAKINGRHIAATQAPKLTNKIATLSAASKKLVMIGSSTGGPRALLEVLPRIPKGFPAPIAVVQHMPPGPFVRSIAQRLESISNIKVREAQNDDRLKPGLALIAPGGAHMLIEKDGVIKLNHGPSVNSVKPSVDVMMDSGVSVFGRNSIGVILTGMGHDGANGMAAIKKHGGKTIAEHESTCVIYGMPKAVIDNGDADRVVPLHQVSAEIVKLIEEND
jgi:two-component system chemotaxis response regulator CheB